MEDSREAGDSDNENADTDEAEAGSSNSNKPSTSHHLPSSNRQMRNLAEKARRDKLNTYISELATLVPMVARSPKRMDKTSILRLTATYLRMNRTLYSGERETLSLPRFLEMSNFSQTLLEEMDGFLLIVTTTGKIVFVTHTVEKLLGHSQNDLLGQLLYNITSPEDHEVLRKNLTPDPDPSAPTTSSVGQASNSVDDVSSDESTCSSTQSCSSPRTLIPVSCREPPPLLERQKRSFNIRLSQRAVSRSEAVNYEPVHVQGHLRIPQHPKDESSNSSRKNDTVLVAVVKLYKECHIAELSLLEANRDEYITRHLIDGRFIYSDHRISVVSGYLPEEVSGISAFKFMHKEDFMFVITALRQMYDKYQEGEGYGSSVYRLRCKTGEYNYMRTHGYVEYSKTTHQVESFICVNTLISPEEGKAGLKEMRARYSASVKNATKKSLLSDDAASASSSTNVIEDKSADDDSEETPPKREGLDVIEMAISKLISNFPPPSPACEEKQDTENPPPDSQFVKVVQFSKSIPLSHIQAAQVSLEQQNSNELKKTPQRSSSLDSNSSASSVLRSQMERPSVITERPSVFSVNPAARVPIRTESVCVFKRTSSSVAEEDNECIRTSKRLYRSRQQEIPVEDSPILFEQPRLSPEQQHRVIMTRDMDSLEMDQDTTVLHLNKPLPLVSDGMFPIQNSPLNAASQSPTNFGMDNGDISHFQNQSINSPTDDPFRPYIPGMENNAAELVDILATDPGFLFEVPEENLYADTGSNCLESNILQVPLEPEFPTGQQVQLTLVEHQVTKCHHQLQSRMHQQGTQINSIVHDLQQVPSGNQVFGADITQLRAEHRRQEELLQSIQEDHHRNSSCKEKLKVSTVRHNVGV